MEGPFRDAPPGLKVIETLLSGGPRTEAHLARAARTCAALGFPFDAPAARRAHAAVPPGRRLRLTFDAAGRVEAATAPLAPAAEPWRVAIAEQRIEAGDPWRRVKTTHRAIYDDARAAMGPGLDELIFLNERGELAEGGITNLFIEDGGILLTPPLTAGALPGILRAALLGEGRAVERRLTPGDLSQGRLYMGNSLRGLIPARLA